MVSVSYHDTVNDLQALGLRDNADCGPFDRFDWFALLEQVGGKTPLVALARNDAEFVALPLMRENGSLEPLANWYSFTWRPLASAREPALLEALARDLKGRSGRVTLSALPDEDGSATAMQKAFCAVGWATILEHCDNNHVLPVEGRSYAEYLAGRPGQLRTTLKRKTKHVETEILTYFEPSVWQSYETIYGNSWKPEEGAPAMLRAFAEQEGAAGRLRLGIARHQGDPVAAQLWTVENGVAYIHKLAHLEEAKPLSAGTVLTAALMEHTIARDRVTLVDFGTGDDGYKRDWMEAVRPRYRLTALDPRNPRTWPALVRARLRQLASGKRGG
ncbi:MAG TPA: GNAT family N-acetyltransferase [Croceibacterium sp.]|nr:GNAT family N-acetyltransferase [Croceibacterium sp.]